MIGIGLGVEGRLHLSIERLVRGTGSGVFEEKHLCFIYLHYFLSCLPLLRSLTVSRVHLSMRLYMRI